MPKKEETLLSLDITFSKSPKKAVDRRALLKKMRSLIEKERESLPFEDITFEKNLIAMVTKKFFFAISSGKPMSMKIALRKPKKNIEEGNDLGNRVVNYVNTIFGDFGKRAKGFSMEIFPLKERVNLARKIIEERKIAKLNELTRKTMNPVGLMFEYSGDGRENLLISFQFERASGVGAFSRYTYKDSLPWDLLLSEHNVLVNSAKIIDKLAEV